MWVLLTPSGDADHHEPMASNPINQAFGRAVATRRDELGMTQAALATRVGLARASVANIERGRQNILLYQVYDLADALNLEKVADLLPPRPRPDRIASVPISDASISDSARQQIDNVIASAVATARAKI
jgi:transcriptional regulator with XRE-family HTH domain